MGAKQILRLCLGPSWAVAPGYRCSFGDAAGCDHAGVDVVRREKRREDKGPSLGYYRL